MAAEAATPSEAALDAAQNGNVPLLRALLEQDRAAVLAARESGGARWTAVHCAAAFGGVACLRLLLDSGADSAATTALGHTPLVEAVRHKMRDCVTLLLRRAPETVDSRTLDGQTALHFAARCGDPWCLEALIAAGATRNVVDSDGFTPLRVALVHGTVRTAEHLLEGGNEMAVHELDRQAQTELMVAAALGKVDYVRLLLRFGARVNACDPRGSTALCFAAGRGAADCVAELLAAGAAVDAVGRSGRTPLHLAVLAGSHETMAALLEAGTNPLVRGADGQLPSEWVDVGDARGAALLGGFERRWALLAALIGVAQRGSPLTAHFASTRLYDRRLWRAVARFV